MRRLILAFCVWSAGTAAWAGACAPTIGVSGEAYDSRTVVPLMSVLRALGANPVYLEQKDADAATDLANLDGLVLGGNNGDIDPARYGEKPHPKTSIETNLARRDYEFEAVELALKRKLPLLGICGGMQRMNLSGSIPERGSLIQHVEGQNQALGERFIAPYIATERIGILPQTTLASIAGGHEGKVNSYHHQAPDKMRSGFRVSAISEHGTIEAMEPEPDGPYADQFAIGVMWHPEFSADSTSIALIKQFIKATQKSACR